VLAEQIWKLKVSEQNFVVKHWQLREAKFVTVYSKSSSNLCCNSNQFFFPKTRKLSPLSIPNSELSTTAGMVRSSTLTRPLETPGYFKEAYLSLERTPYVPHAFEYDE
jgi:hypothetical protein